MTMISKRSVYLIALLLAGGTAPAQQLPCAPPAPQRSDYGQPCAVRPKAFLVAAAQAQQQAPAPDVNMGMEHMEMRSSKDLASDVSAVQEPENPNQKTGSDSPVVDLLAEVRKTAPKKLQEFEQLAATTNPTIKQAEALVRAAAGRARQAGLMPNPTIGYEGAEIRGGEFGGGEHGAFVQQTFVLGGKLGLRREALEEQRKADELGVAEQRLSVLGAVRVQFYATLTAQQAAEVRAGILKLMLDAAATAHQLANVGQADAPDVLQTEVEAEQAKLDFDAAQRQYIQEFRTLAAVAGQPEMRLAMVSGDLEHPPEIDAQEMMADILANSPSVKRAEQQAHAAEAAVKRERRELIPDVTVRAGGEQNFEQNSAGRAVGYQSFASASMQIPIFDRNQGNVAASSAELERAQSEVLRVQLSLTQEAQPFIQQYAASKLQAERYRTQLLPRAQRAYELYQHKYHNMGAAYPQVIISQRTFFQLQENYVKALGEQWVTSQQLENLVLARTR